MSNQMGSATLNSLLQQAQNVTGQQAVRDVPDAPCDPIAIAALVAELPELEVKFFEADKAREEALKALNDIQRRLDLALETLKRHAPKGSLWNSRKPEFNIQQLAQEEARQKYLAMQAQVLGMHQQKMDDAVAKAYGPLDPYGNYTP